MNDITSRLACAPVVPLIQADDPSVAIATARALAKGGLTVLEVVLRTPAALECLQALCALDDDIVVGAGTVLNAKKTHDCIERGAAFIVSPGLDEGSVHAAQSQDVPIYPGVMTPSEVMRAISLGLDVVKFFPASIAGGVPALKALGSVFGELKFMPTGGVSAANLHEFLAVPSVLACGGSWLTPKAAIADGDYEQVTTLASEAIKIATQTRGEQK
ncbi:MAG: bifunctional 4-hydroxy-2-oxoglutarate aldolase/2-dehydro-3-deoxy-phosphogluconate aldolase [Gammaproteobacteria bacterium]|nr:bifunctional 4-hydroxy-2-oxoglutarate aldolase/2-dehydro-3-deoxy-phosphogluconate aldolase [Gammaproteobacteria bacterium]MDH5618098.1 bifunctional 4-hydroxy-2-oxoglutarate aldolase/2-dehydro-3-deoxy-phosphogluconate aldolase [Gammaproteobacteria bacterium]